MYDYGKPPFAGRKEKGFDVGPLAFFNKNGESETLPSLSGGKWLEQENDTFLSSLIH